MNAPQSNLAQRWITALVILPVVLALIWVPVLAPGLAVLVVFIILLVMLEFYGLFRTLKVPVQEKLGLVGGVLIAAHAFIGHEPELNFALVIAVILVGFGQVLNAPPSAAGLAASVAGLVYAAWSPAHVLLLFELDYGRGLVMMLLVTVVFTDTGAYFAGRTFGRLPLAPVVSPKKTWEGAIGGLLLAVIAMAVIALLRENYAWPDFPDWSLARYAMTGAAVSVVAQLSDLMKSLVKRDAGVKDSGRILPGHGGALDRFDGFLLGAPVLYYMAVL